MSVRLNPEMNSVGPRPETREQREEADHAIALAIAAKLPPRPLSDFDIALANALACSVGNPHRKA